MKVVKKAQVVVTLSHEELFKLAMNGIPEGEILPPVLNKDNVEILPEWTDRQKDVTLAGVRVIIPLATKDYPT